MVSETHTPRFYANSKTACLNPCFSGGWSRRATPRQQRGGEKDVLILVLVEDGLGAHTAGDARGGHPHRLNPCFSGGWSRSSLSFFSAFSFFVCLNPCFSGGWSRRRGPYGQGGVFHNRLNPCFSGGWSRRDLFYTMVQFSFVLILVLVEDGLGDLNKHLEKIRRLKSLNPCFSGGWSRRATFGIGCQRDCCNEIFNFVNVWRPKICTFSGAFTGANIRIIFVNGAFFDAGFRAIFAFLSAMGRIAMGGYRWSGLTRDAECRFFFVGGDVADSKFGCG